ncbi:MAG: hypothetical protein ING59_08195 [Burkholderiales bacterium]|nr:hypothetical protein [Burkholderiales bacterium]
MSALTLPSRGEAANGALRYERHRPEQTTLYRLVQQHAASFIAHTEASTGQGSPGSRHRLETRIETPRVTLGSASLLGDYPSAEI